MANNEKIISQSVFEEAIKDVLTELVNSTYSWESYSDEEVGQLVELDPTQVAELTAVINDSACAKNKVYSSQHTKELLQENLIEANKYTDDLVANLSNIKLDIVDSLPDSSNVNKSTIYILKDSSGGTNNTLNVWSDSTSAFVEVGKLSVDFTNYYTKSEVDTELAKKANADEVLKPDAIVSDLTTTSGSTTLSTAGLQTELDKVVKTADIKTTLDENSTNDDVYGGKAIFDAIHESISMILSSASDITTLLAKLKSLAPGKSAVIKLYDDSRILFPVTGNYIGTVSVINGNEIIVICVNHWNSKHAYTFRVQTDDTSISLNKICTTSVKDIPWTIITGNLLSTKVKFSNADSYVSYYVKNGTCYVTIWSMTILAECGVEVLFNGLPEAAITGSSSLKTANASFGLVFTGDGGQILTNVDASCIGRNGYCTLSYPVKES